jgi:hypothetical protein
MLSTCKHSLKNTLSALKHLLYKLPPPPNFTSKDAPILAVAAIHATVLAIVIGVFSTYGFYRHTVREQLSMKLFQEADKINTLRFHEPPLIRRQLIPGQAIKEAQKLVKDTSLGQRAQELSSIISKGKDIKLNVQDEVDTAQELGRRAYHLMLAIMLHYPFPETTESFRNPTSITFPNIDKIQSWEVDLHQVTTPLILAHEIARNGLGNVLGAYWQVRGRQEYQGYHINLSYPFLGYIETAHRIGQGVRERLQELERHENSSIGTGWLLGGLVGACVTFGIGVLMPVHKFPIFRNLLIRSFLFWEPTFFYLLVLGSIFYLIFIR